jgi:hypothetical protein
MKWMLILYFFMSSCSTVARIGYGAKKPQVENFNSITKWVNAKRFSTGYIIASKPAPFWNSFLAIGTRPLIYTKSGELIFPQALDGKFCPKDFDSYLQQLKPPSQNAYSVINTTGIGYTKQTAFDSLQSTTQLLDGKPFVLNKEWVQDYIIVIPFAKFLGNRVQVSEIKKWLKGISNNNTTRFTIIYLNFDKQEVWGEEWIKKNTVIV